MERKTIGSIQVTAEEVERSLERRAERLTPEEERVLRMRHGARPPREALLPRADGGNSALADELLLIEMQLLRARMGAGRTQGLPRMGGPSRAKAKIVRALRRKSE